MTRRPAPRALSQEEAAAIQTVVLAAAAEQHGMVVTDQAVNDYLEMITRNLVSPAEFEKIVGSLHGDARNMSQAYLFDALRRELLASRYSFMYQVSLASVLPAPRWEYFQELNRRATAEVLGVPVERFVKDVPEPSDAELKAFFEKYPETLPVPNSPTPGFKRPAKANVSILCRQVTADFTDRAMAQVTPEEMRDYYEKNKDVRYRERQGQARCRPTLKSGTPKPTTPSPRMPSPTTKPADAEARRARSRPMPRPGRERAANRPPGQADRRQSPPMPARNRRGRSPLRACIWLPWRKSRTPKRRPPLAAATTPPAARQLRQLLPPHRQPADATQPPRSHRRKTCRRVDRRQRAGTSEAASAEAAAGDKPSSKKDVKYEPFEKVEEEIRKTLAGEKANQAMIEDIFQRLSTKMREYSSCSGDYEVQQGRGPRPRDTRTARPAGPGQCRRARSAKRPIWSVPTKLQADTDLGKSFSFIFDRRSPFGYREVPFPAIGFTDRSFKPELDRRPQWRPLPVVEGQGNARGGSRL